MKRLALSGAALLVATVAAGAADLPLRSPPPYIPPPPPPPLWTGPFVGLHAGFTFGKPGNEVDGKGLFCNGDFCDGYTSGYEYVSGGKSSDGSFAGGAQIGYNVQLNPSFLIGGVVDFTWMDRSSSRSKSATSYDPPWSETIEYSDSMKQDWLATARLRAGLTFDNLLIYGTGGVAMGGLKSSASTVSTWYYNDSYYGVASSGSGSSSSTAFGWAAGAGAEFRLTRNWSLFGEWLYYSISDSYTVNVAQNPQVVGSATDSFRVKVKANGHLAKFGLNYAFMTY